MKTCLIVGCRGMLGSRLSSHVTNSPVGAGYRVAGCDLPEIDITDAASIAGAFERERPDIVINCAAYTNVDGAETDRESALRLNAAGPELLAQAARAAGALLLHISTDFVFDGARCAPYREQDPPNPQGVYAKSKLLGELAVAAEAGEHLIVRTAWLYGPNGRNFVDTILRLARERGELSVVDDQAGSPTYTGVLADFLWKLVLAEARGLYHLAGSGVCTWYDLACEAVRLAGLDVPVRPVATAEMPRPAPRPRNSALDCGKAERLLDTPIPGWRQGLARYLKG